MNDRTSKYILIVSLLSSVNAINGNPGEFEPSKSVKPVHETQHKDDVEFAAWHTLIPKPRELVEKQQEEKIVPEKKSIYQTIKQRFSFDRRFEKSVDVRLNKKIDHVKNSIQKSLEKTWDTIMTSASFAKKKLSSIRKTLKKSIDDLTDRVADFFDPAPTPSLQKMVQNEIKELKKQAKEMKEEITDLLHEDFHLDELKQKTSKLFSRLADKIKDVVSDVNTKLRQAARDVKRAMQ